MDEKMNPIKVQVKEEHALENIKQTPRPSKTLHALSCRGEAMIQQEHIHHSTTMWLDMDTTSNMNILALLCQVMS